jgi:DNA-directed RNA polymerase II subunit RPB1
MTTCVALLETVESPRITNIQFGLLNPDLVRKQSVVQVTKSTLYQRQLPHSGGLNDLRMGTSDRRLPCGTCKNDVLSCVGHPGHIELAAPVYHVSMINVVLKVLRCVCYWCSRLLVDVEEDPRAKDERLKTLDPKDRLNFMVNLCKTRHFCRHCNGPQPKYTQMRSATQIKTDFRDKDESTFETPEEAAYVKQPFTPAIARSILRFIPDDEVELLGINPKYARPEWMVLTVLQVPPPISRPSIMATDGSRARGQDDITIKLQDILKASLALQAAFENARLSTTDIVTPVPPAVLSAWDVLQQHLSQFMHHDTGSTPGAAASASGGAPPRSNRPLRLIPARIKGKKGRFRGTLGGKRVDYSARTVVSPAPGYDIDEVGVPEMIAQHLTFPERVTTFNHEELTKRVRNGPGMLYGAVAIVMPDGSLVDLTLVEDRESIELQVGWVVERYLKNGDWVLFNRQPSLHRMSIMAHRVRIIQDKTFRLPICDTTPYNADFDGDEMNLHVIRTVEGIAEARELMSVTTQLISPQSNKPIIGLVQDSLVAVYLLTQKDTFLTRAQISQMVMPIQYPLFTKLPPPAIVKPVPLWTGKQLFSLLFPAFSLDIAVRSGAAASLDKQSDGFMDMAERRVVVKNGELMAGSLCKKTMGTSAGGIIHVLVKDCGNDVAARFIGDAQRVLVEFLLHHGFSVGVGDCIMPHETHMKVNGSINRSLVYGDQIRADASDAPPTLVEACMFKLMTGVLTRTGALVQEDLPLDNRVYTMVQSGAKGSSVNIAQILGCVGQQSVEGGRIAPDVNGRTLPCYLPHEQTAESRGFVANSYGTGLTAQEYFMHSMGGREGLVVKYVISEF